MDQTIRRKVKIALLKLKQVQTGMSALIEYDRATGLLSEEEFAGVRDISMHAHKGQVEAEELLSDG